MARFSHLSARCLVLAAALLCLLAFSIGAQAQGTAGSTGQSQETATSDDVPSVEALGGLTAGERSQLFSRLSDEQARRLLLDYLQWTSGESRPQPGITDQLEAQAGVFRERLASALATAPQLPGAPAILYSKLTGDRGPWQPLLLLFFLAVIAGGGWLAERLYQRLVIAIKARLLEKEPRDFVAHVGRTLILLTIDMVGLAIFVAVALGLFLAFYQGHEASRVFVTQLLMAIVIFRVFLLFSRPLFWPRPGFAPLLPFPEAAGRILHRHVVAAAAIGSFGYAMCEVIFQAGLAEEPHSLMRLGVGTVIMLTLLWGVWSARKPVADALAAAAGEGRSVLAALAPLWHLPLLVYLLAIYAVAVFNAFSDGASRSSPGVLSLLLLVLLFVLDRLLYSLLSRLLPDEADHGGARQVFERACHILVGVLAVIGLAWIWDAPLFAFDEASLAGRLSRAVLDVVLTVFVGYLVWGVLKAAVARHLPEPAQGDEESRGDEGGGGSASRLGTVLPLLMKAAQITIATMVVMVALSAMGVNIGPLLAGAGVIGLAVGFGAQTLVRDSGLFFLIDDAFRKGEYVDVGGAKGTVEKINMRSLVLRHHMGPLHTIPFGEIQTLSNYSRDWVIMKLEFRVGYNTDPNKVKKLFKKIGAEMLEDPILGPDFLEPFKSQGVKAMEDSAMIVRGKFMAKPGKQFTIRKEIYNRVRQAFEENGIEFAHRRVTVDLPEDVKLTPEQQEKVAEAAAAAVAAGEEEGGPGAPAKA